MATNAAFDEVEHQLNIIQAKSNLYYQLDIVLWEIEKVREKLEIFKNTVQLLNMNTLPADLVTPKLLSDTLLGMARMAKEDEYHLLARESSDYYREETSLIVKPR